MQEDESMFYQNNLKGDTLKYLPVKILPAISGLLTIFFLTRTLSSSTYASFSFITATLLVFLQLISGWINSSVIFFYPDYKESSKLDDLKVNVIGLQLLLYALGACGFAIVSYIGLKEFLLVFISLGLLFSQTFLGLLYSFLQAERKILVQIRSTGIQSILQISGLIVCYFHYKENLHYIITIFFFSYFVANLYVMYCDDMFKRTFLRQLSFKLDPVAAKGILFYGLPICIWFFSSQFYAVGDRIMLRYFGIIKLVGNYASFRDISVGLSGFITMPLLLAFHPIIIQMWKNGVEKMHIESIISQNLKLLTTLFTPFFMGLFLVGDWVLTKIVGRSYLLDNNLMFMVLLSIFLGTISMYLHKGLEITGKTVIMAKVAFSIAVMSLIANLVFLPKFGVLGACITSVSSQIMYCLLIYYFSRKVLKIRISVRFLLKHLFVILFALMCSKVSIKSPEIFLTVRFSILMILIGYLFFSSDEILNVVKLTKK